VGSGVEEREVRGFVPLPLEVYARIKVASWRDVEPLETVLSQHAVDELRWRQHEHWLKSAMAHAARDRDPRLVLEVAAAIRRARAEARRAQESSASAAMDDLERYARIRAALELAGEDDEDAALAGEGLTRLAWDELRIDWSERTRHDPELSRRVRKAIGRARRGRSSDELSSTPPS
jgi:hypothetical protein